MDPQPNVSPCPCADVDRERTVKCREREALAAVTAASELDRAKRGKAGSRASLHLGLVV
jgi:hypothetical protein